MKPVVTVARRDASRRTFLRSAVTGGAALAFSLSGFLPPALRARPRLRPPGALEEHDFLAACVKCGQCVQVCPVSALKPAELDDGFGVGVPFLEPRAQACDFSCDVGQCILACPTGALTYHRSAFLGHREGTSLARPPVLLAKRDEPEPTLAFTERLGLARLARPLACLSVKGLGLTGTARGASFRGTKRWSEVDRWRPTPVKDHRYALEHCDVCVRECPIEGAISIEAVDGRLTPVVHEPCVGCGVCEMMCPVEPAAIEVVPRGTWPGGAS